MKPYDIIFQLNGTQKIILSLEESLDHVHCCYWANIFFIQHDARYLLMNEVVRYSMDCFVGALKKVLANKLKLHPSIEIDGQLTKDIGYIFNENRQGNNENVVEEIENGEKYAMWVGYKYMVWGKNAILWMYNDDTGNIFLEITPSFPGKPTYLDLDNPLTQEEKENITKYKQWIKTYQPILIKKIPQSTAEKWLKQANDILAIIRKNVEQIHEK